MAKRYSISFNTSEAPGKIRAVWVEMGHWFMKDTDIANVGLAAHPLYPELEAYVLANPSGRHSKGDGVAGDG